MPLDMKNYPGPIDEPEPSVNGPVIVAAIVILLAVGGYYQFSYKPAKEAPITCEAVQ